MATDVTSPSRLPLRLRRIVAPHLMPEIQKNRSDEHETNANTSQEYTRQSTRLKARETATNSASPPPSCFLQPTRTTSTPSALALAKAHLELAACSRLVNQSAAAPSFVPGQAGSSGLMPSNGSPVSSQPLSLSDLQTQLQSVTTALSAVSEQVKELQRQLQIQIPPVAVPAKASRSQPRSRSSNASSGKENVLGKGDNVNAKKAASVAKIKGAKARAKA
ncbi:hypothetical protein BD414DRAFT_503439 [Trametes punicea]|nr:hypothetical protein BD414DRAFT_503439 [Trametes punicea]